MAEPTFNVIFRGGLVPGHEQETVRGALVGLFRLPPAVSAALFSGQTVIVKRSATATEAAWFEQEFLRLGAVVTLEPATLPTTPGQATGVPLPASPPAAQRTSACPGSA